MDANSHKFYDYTYWRHVRQMDVFLAINIVYFNPSDDSFQIQGSWCTQGVDEWWMTIVADFKIADHQYHNWVPYEPKGSPRL